MSVRAKSFADLPVYADDIDIGTVVLGPSRASEWKALAPLLEPKGLPRIDGTHGGRYVPDVARFYGVPITETAELERPRALRGVEHPEALCNRNAPKRRA